jgi:response regulator RpfG family c-di-GMP phosphodiesterase
MSFSSVLIVDDEPAVRELMSRWVSAMGLEARTAGNTDEALAQLHETHYDLAVVDVRLPGRNGLWLADALRRDYPNTAVVLATAYTELLENGTPAPAVADLLIKPFRRDRFVEAVDRSRAWHERARVEVEWHAQLLEGVQRAVAEIRNYANEQRRRGVDEVDALMAILQQRLPDVHAHSERVAAYATELAATLDLDATIVAGCEQSARLHDIGKLAIPETLLSTPGALRPGEIAIIRRHADAGAEMLADTYMLRDIAPLVRSSHEWFGGGGYPDNLSGNAIPMASRIIAVVDAYDAMTNDRIYRDSVDAPTAAAELLRCSPRQFDPEVVIPFLATLKR